MRYKWEIIWYNVCLESVEKKCGYNGRWEGQNGTNNDSPHGWANYTTCMTPEMLRLHGKVYTNAIEGNVSICKSWDYGSEINKWEWRNIVELIFIM